jgi:hypothetical protein
MGFFNMHAESGHIIQQARDYHWNRLSKSGMKVVFEKYASEVEIICIDEFLKSRFNCQGTSNKKAYTFIISM